MRCDVWADINAFHRKFQLPQQPVPSFPEKAMMDFRMKFLKEELDELIEAYAQNDLVKGFDALIDLVYVAVGTAYIMNMPWPEGWQHVQSANMKKVRAKKESDSTRGSTFDVVKPKGWIKPDRMLLAEIILLENALLEDIADQKGPIGVEDKDDE